MHRRFRTTGGRNRVDVSQGTAYCIMIPHFASIRPLLAFVSPPARVALYALPLLFISRPFVATRLGAYPPASLPSHVAPVPPPSGAPIPESASPLSLWVFQKIDRKTAEKARTIHL